MKNAENAVQKCKLQIDSYLSTLANFKTYTLFLPQYLISNRMKKFMECGGSQCTLYSTLLQ
jgi:hypothetical protein